MIDGCVAKNLSWRTNNPSGLLCSNSKIWDTNWARRSFFSTPEFGLRIMGSSLRTLNRLPLQIIRRSSNQSYRRQAIKFVTQSKTAPSIAISPLDPENLLIVWLTCSATTSQASYLGWRLSVASNCWLLGFGSLNYWREWSNLDSLDYPVLWYVDELHRCFHKWAAATPGAVDNLRVHHQDLKVCCFCLPLENWLLTSLGFNETRGPQQ